MKAPWLMPLLLPLACNSPGTSQRGDGAVADAASGGDGAPANDAASPSCKGEQTSNLAGVSLVVSGPCRFTLAQTAAGIKIPYEVRIQSDVSGVVPRPQDAGGCDRPDGSGLIPLGQLSGGTQRYCRCDSGRCIPPDNNPVTLRAGTYPGTFPWDGRNWTGPSDTGNPEGPAFPPGDYTFKIDAVGSVEKALFDVTATYPITLVP